MTFLNITDELNYQQLKSQVSQRLHALIANEGYIFVEPNFFEDYETFVLKNQRVKKERMVKMIDNDGKILVLRPDITTSLMRQVIPRWKSDSELKLFYHSTIFTRSNQGEILPVRQFGLELIGSQSSSADSTVLNLASKVFNAFELPYMMEISDTCFLDGIMEDLGLSDVAQNQLKDILYRKSSYDLTGFINDITIDDAQRGLMNSLLTLQGPLDRIEAILSNYSLNPKSKEAIKALNKQMRELHDPKRFMVDLSLVSTYDYYEGILFKGYLKGSQHEVLSGGRYDPLTENYGQKTSAIGFTLDTQELIKEVISHE